MALMDEIRIAQRDAGEAAVTQNLERMGLGLKNTQTEEQKIAELTAQAHRARDAAEKAWYALFAALPVGPERTQASVVFDRIRNATRRIC